MTASPWTSEDHALMLAWAQHQGGMDTACGQPREKAWHPKNDPVFFDVAWIPCHACTAIKQAEAEDGQPVKPVRHPLVTDTRDYDAHPLPPFSMDDLDD